MSSGNFLHVSIGEIKLGTGEDILQANLGSCVGLGFLWKQRGLYGLAHCLLPEPVANQPVKSTLAQQASPGRFVSAAVPTLMKWMKIEKSVLSEIDVILVGGGNMTAPVGSAAEKMIGHLNVVTALTQLKRFSLSIRYRETGGQTGRRIQINCQTGDFEVLAIPRIQPQAA